MLSGVKCDVISQCEGISAVLLLFVAKFECTRKLQLLRNVILETAYLTNNALRLGISGLSFKFYRSFLSVGR